MQSIQLKQYLDGFARPDNGSYGNVRAYTANYAIGDVGDAGDVFSNTGAAGAVTFTLPVPRNGRVLSFLKTVTQNFTILASGGAKVNGSAANGTFANTAAENGKFAELIADGTNWYVTGSTGTWTTT